MTDAEVGKNITVEVSYTDGHNNAEGPLVSLATTAVTNTNESPAGIPTINGTPTQGQVLTAITSGISDGDGLGIFSYVWKANGAVISGATANTLTLTETEVGKTITVEVSYIDGHGTAEGPLSSTATPAVANINDIASGIPVISGTATQGQMLTAVTSSINDADGLGTFSYVWKANGTIISGATANTLTLTEAQVGKVITVEVSYTDGHGTVEGPLASSATDAVANINDIPVGVPTITGTATQGQTLTAVTNGISDADGLGLSSYVWKANGSVISGATADTYTLTETEVGKTITVEVAYTDAHGTAEGPLSSLATSPIANINDTPVGTPVITGTATQGQTLTAITGGISDADGLGAFSYLWKANGVIISGATADTLTLTEEYVDKTITVAVNYTDGHGAVEGPLTSLATSAIANINDVPVGLPTINGTATQSQVLTAVTSGISDADGLGVFDYVWKANGNVISGATSSTYKLTEAQVGKTITVEVSYTDGHGTHEGPLASIATPVVNNINDLPVGLPVITGTAAQGQILTAVTSGISDADGLGVFSYVWKANGSVISGATNSTYMLTEAQVGKTITVSVNYTDGHNTVEGPLTSLATAVVANINDAPTGTPTITGTATQGQTLTAVTSGISDADGLGVFSYVWKANGAVINGAIANTLTLAEAQVGKTITVSVNYTDGHGTVEGPLTSLATSVIANINDAPVGLPTIIGTATQGQVLSAVTSGISDADGLGAFSYVWKANGTVISGANSSTYLLTDAEVGKTITVGVSYTDGHGTAEGLLTSNATAAVTNTNQAPIGQPTITGTVKQGETLTAMTNGISDTDGLGAFSYVWKANGSVISGATASTLTLAEAQVGKTITVAVSYTDGHGTAEGPLTSLATAIVANINDAPTGIPTITGTAKQGQTLSAVTSSISDADGLGAFSYVWKANGNVISGETTNTLTLTEAQVGKNITVAVNYTDGHGTAEGPLTSLATDPVANTNDAPVGIPSITGTATQGQTLTAVTNGISDADGLGVFSYVWKANGTIINGATGNTYLLTDAEVGTTITVDVSYTDGHGTAEGVLTSHATAVVTNTNEAPLGIPTISGTAAQGQILTAVTTGISDADGLGIFSYIWKADGAVIGGATGSTYLLTEAEVGKTITVGVSYIDGRNTAEGPLISHSTAIVANLNDAPDGIPSITGTASQGQTLTAITNGISDADGLGVFSYLWKADGVAINNATASTYLLTSSEVGKTITVDVSFTDGHGTPEGPLSSVATAAVTNINEAPVGIPVITGTLIEGEMLTANNDGISDADGLGTFSYVWKADGQIITGATGSTYTLTAAEVGKTIIVDVSYTDGHGTVESLSSLATAVVSGSGSENLAPTTINLSAAGLNENVAANTLVGNFTSIDANFGDTFMYSLVDGVGSSDNAAFTLIGNQLQINASPNFEAKANYSIRVRSTDQGGLFIDKVFTLTINNQNDAPVVAHALDDQDAEVGTVFSYTMPDDSFSDEDTGDNLNYSASLADGSPLPAWLSFNPNTRSFTGTPTVGNTGVTTIKVTAADQSHADATSLFAIHVVNPNSNTAPILSLGVNQDTAAYAVTLQTDGKVLVAGFSQTDNNKEIVLVRYTVNGHLDHDFSQDGKVVTTISEFDDIARAVVSQNDGKIVVAGNSYNSSNSDFVILRYNSDGSLDTGFSGDGKLTTTIGNSDDFAYAVCVQNDGKILAAGYSNNGNNGDFALVRYNSDGSLDSNFSGDGKVTTDFDGGIDNAYAMALQADGKILLAGTSHGNGGVRFALARYNTDGSLDTSFSGDGKVQTQLNAYDDQAYAVSVQSNGDILVAGESWNGSGNDFAVVRYHSDGSLDTSFNGDGKLVTALNNSYDYARSMYVQTDGKILVSGYSRTGDHVDYAMLRYNSDGSLDNSFGNHGIVLTSFTGINSYGAAVTEQNDGKIVLAGYSSDGSQRSITVARFNSDGSLDKHFENPDIIGFTGTPVIINSHAHLYDNEFAKQGHYNGATVTLMRHGGAVSTDTFVGSGELKLDGGQTLLSGVNVGTVSHGNGMLTIIFNTNATQARVDAVLSALTYVNTADDAPTTVVIDWLVSDEVGLATTATSHLYLGTGNTSLTLNTPDNINYTDTVFADKFTVTVGQLTASEDGDGLKYGIVGGLDNGKGSISKHDTYGVLTINENTGAYRFVPNKSAIEPLTSEVSATFTVTVDNGSETDSQNLLLSIHQSGITESYANDRLLGSLSNDVINALKGNDSINGKAGEDLILSGNGNDFIAGGNGSDHLKGASGKDTIIGGNGNDVIIGGSGSDRLTGGQGEDSFVLNTISAVSKDTITDFAPEFDTIKLAHQIFTELGTTSKVKAGYFVTADKAQDPNDHLIYHSDTGVLAYDADGSSSAHAVAIALLGSGLNLTAADFVVI